MSRLGTVARDVVQEVPEGVSARRLRGGYKDGNISGLSEAMKTTTFPKGQPERAWHLLDANDAVLGRLASQVARILMGKHKPTYTPFLDTGDHVVVINAAKIRLTGGKEGQKVYRRYSGYPGGLVEVGAPTMRATRPDRMILLAVRGMLPKTKLGKQMLRKLRVYPGPVHKQQAQKPGALAVAE